MHIGFATQNVASDYWLIITHGAQAGAATRGITMTTIPATTLEQQLAALHTLIDQRVDVLLLGALTSTGYAAVVARAQAAHIPIVDVSSYLLDSTVTCSVRPDHRRGATLVTTQLITQLGGAGAIVHLMGPQHMQEAVDRAVGVRDTVARAPGIQLVVETDIPDWSAAQAQQRMQAILDTHPQVAGICAANDTIALGAAEAVARAGRTGQILITGFDAAPDALIAIRDGRMYATVQASMLRMGQTAIEIAQRVGHGHTVPVLVETPLAVIDAANLIDAALESMEILPAIMRSAIERGDALSRMQDAVIQAQQTALQELTNPVIPITDTVVVMPLIGPLDAVRAQQVVQTLLHSVAATAPRFVIVDLTGVPQVDGFVAAALIQAAQAVRLLGGRIVLTGVRPDLAQSLMATQLEQTSIITRPSLQQGIAYALRTDRWL